MDLSEFILILFNKIFFHKLKFKKKIRKKVGGNKKFDKKLHLFPSMFFYTDYPIVNQNTSGKVSNFSKKKPFQDHTSLGEHHFL